MPIITVLFLFCCGFGFVFFPTSGMFSLLTPFFPLALKHTYELSVLFGFVFLFSLDGGFCYLQTQQILPEGSYCSLLLVIFYGINLL